MLYHASQTPNLKELTPHISNHGKPLVYFSEKRENTLVYLSNAVEKCCHEEGFKHKGIYEKWGSYGFNSKGILVLDEYYPDATYETYKGVSGFIYSASDWGVTDLEGIPFAKVSENMVKVESCEFVSDAYEALCEAEKKGLVVLTRYEDNSPQKLEWIRKTILSQYKDSSDKPEYRFFLEKKFGDILVIENGGTRLLP